MGNKYTKKRIGERKKSAGVRTFPSSCVIYSVHGLSMDASKVETNVSSNKRPQVTRQAGYMKWHGFIVIAMPVFAVHWGT